VRFVNAHWSLSFQGGGGDFSFVPLKEQSEVG